MGEKNLNKAIDEIRQLSGDTARLYGVGPIEILVYATTHELRQHMTLEQAQATFAEAWQNLELAGG
jgi:hypothetical protein